MPNILHLRAIRKGIGKEWEDLAVSNYTCAALFRHFQVVWAVIDTQTYVDLLDYSDTHESYTGTAQELLDLLGDSISVKQIPELTALRRSIYSTAASLGYTATPCDDQAGLIYGVSQDGFDHMLIASWNTQSIYGASAASAAVTGQLFVLNGLLHKAIRRGSDLILLGANVTKKTAKEEQLGVISLPLNCKLSYQSFSDLSVAQSAGWLLSIAGFLFTPSSPGVSVIEDVLTLDFQAMDMAKKLYEASTIIDLSSLSLNPQELSDNYVFTPQDIQEILSLSQSFKILLTQPITALELSLRSESDDGLSIAAPKLHKRPLLWGVGRIVDYDELYQNHRSQQSRIRAANQDYVASIYKPNEDKPVNPSKYYPPRYLELVCGIPS